MPISENTKTDVTVDAEVIKNDPRPKMVKLYRKDKGEVEVDIRTAENYIKNGEWKEVK